MHFSVRSDSIYKWLGTGIDPAIMVVVDIGDTPHVGAVVSD